MKTVKSEKEKERIRERVKEIGGKTWEDGYKEIADALDKLSRTASDCGCRVEKIVVDDTTSYELRPAYEEIEDIYHQWFPEDGDAPFTKEVFKDLPKRIIASALETVIASEITEMLLSLTSVKRRDHDTPFLSHFKKRIEELRKRFSLNTANISKLTLEELERNFSLSRNDSYYSLLNYLFGPDPNVPSIKDFVQVKHPAWFTYYDKPGDDSSESTKTSSYSLDDVWFVVDPKTCKTKSMSAREIVVGLEKGTLSEEEVFRDLPKPVQAFIKEELEKYKAFLPHDSWHIFIHATGKVVTMTSKEIVDAIIAGTLSEDDAFRTLPGTVKDFVKEELEKYKHSLLYGDWTFGVDREAPIAEMPMPKEEHREEEPESVSVTRGGSTVTFSAPTEMLKGYYSVVNPATGVRTDMTEEQLKEVFRESKTSKYKF